VLLLVAITVALLASVLIVLRACILLVRAWLASKDWPIWVTLKRIYGRSLRWTFPVAALYLFVCVAGFVWHRSWRDETRWRNNDAVTALPPFEKRASRENWTAEHLAQRLKTRDTLVLVSLSGGGSRAAIYQFAWDRDLAHLRMSSES